ncbi:MAG: LytR/AlgR family response regulator transcription factor [Saprospiraceae bacterium]
MRILSALIVDDEARARRTLQVMLTDFCENVSVVGTVGSVDEALDFLYSTPVDVIFLDVSMPEKDGFALAERPEFVDQQIVFITAHAEFAVNAFRVNAADYLLKPVNIMELQSAVSRVRKQLEEDKEADQTALRIFASNEHHLLPYSKILYLEAEGSYSYVVTTEQRYFVSKGLKELGESLPKHGFFRTHRSYIVNLEHVSKVGNMSTATITISNEAQLPLSRYRRSELLKLI